MTEDEALCQILQIASDNNIKIEHRFADSIFDVYEAEYDLCTKEKKIILPMFTDDSKMVQVYSIAHELAHFRNIESKNNIYLKEKKAWKCAKQILLNAGIPLHMGNDNFDAVSEKCLSSYKKFSILSHIKNFFTWMLHNIVSAFISISAFLYVCGHGFLGKNMIALPNYIGYNQFYEIIVFCIFVSGLVHIFHMCIKNYRNSKLHL